MFLIDSKYNLMLIDTVYAKKSGMQFSGTAESFNIQNNELL